MSDDTHNLAIPDSDNPRIVVVGGGFGGMFCVRELLECNAQIVLFDRNNYHTFQPLLYQVATGGLQAESVAYPLRKRFRKAGRIFFRMAEVQRVDPDMNTIYTNIGTLRYDYLVLATGSTTNFFGLTDVSENALPLKTLPDALRMRRVVLENLEKALLSSDETEVRRLTTFVVVGGGPTGVEVAGALAELRRYIIPSDYPDLPINLMTIHVIEGGSELLGGMSATASRKAKQFLEQLGVTIHLDSTVTAYDGSRVLFSKAEGSAAKLADEIQAATVVWAAGVEANPIAGLSRTVPFRSKRIRTDQFSRVTEYDNIFAIGDVAVHVNQKHPLGLPMLAPVAIQQGKQLGRNLCRMLQGGVPKEFRYFDKGTMATVGRNKAVAQICGLTISGIIAWFAWMFVHLLFLIGFRNKVAVFLDWFWNYLNYGQGTRLIIVRPWLKAEKISTPQVSGIIAGSAELK